MIAALDDGIGQLFGEVKRQLDLHHATYSEADSEVALRRKLFSEQKNWHISLIPILW